MLFRSLLCLSFISLLLHSPFFVQGQQDATCAPGRNCKVGCCSVSGWCGFGPDFCGKGNCTSICDAKAECGPYAPAGQDKCPLNVCCSKHGFCGTTSLFCGEGCQNGCTKVTQPSGKGTSARSKTIGYYESWSYGRQCDSVAPEDIDPTMWTHINYAFALINPSTFKISKMNSYDDQLYPRVIDLKMRSPGLKVFIAVGGWDAGGKVFSDMVSSTANRKAFIDSATHFCKTYGFDGIDIDWEYPVAADRGASKADFKNYVTFMKELKSAAGNLGVTLTLPNSYWYLQGFDIVNLEPNVDWFNVMSYDIHGTWDGSNPYTQAVVNPHTNITEISNGLDLLWRNKIPNNKVVLGLGFYGRSFTLKDPSCNKPGCPFASGAKAGECTDTSGVLSNAEIQRIIDDKKLTPVFDQKAGVKWIVWNSDQWVSYDDADTFKIKVDWANKLGLGGIMVWALDLDNKDSQAAQYLNSGGDMSNSNGFNRQKMVADTKQAYTGKLAYWTPCMSEKQRKDTGCPPGYHEILVGHGKTFDSEAFDQSTGCHGKDNRLLCLNNELVAKNCNWNRNLDGSKICDRGCPEGTLFLTQNTHPAGDKSDCAHGTFIAVCCEDLLTLASVCPSQYSADFVFAGGMSGAGVKDFKRKSGAGSQKRELPGPDVVETEIAKLEGRTLEGEQEAEQEMSKVKRADQDTYNPSDPCDAPYEYHFPKPDSKLGFIAIDADQIVLGEGSGRHTWGVRLSKVTVTSTLYPTVETEVPRYNNKNCPGDRYPQLCANWRSIATNHGLRTVPCPTEPVHFNQVREAVNHWYNTHDDSWLEWIEKRVWAPYANDWRSADCQVDEWPPYDLWGSRYLGRAGIYVRYLPGGQNGGGSSWRESRFRFVADCGRVPIPKTTNTPQEYFQPGVWTDTVWIRTHLTSTRTSMVINWSSMPVVANDADLLYDNVCWPKMLAPNVEPGFALNDNDQVYGRPLGLIAAQYQFRPAPAVTRGLTPPTRKRHVELLVYPDDTVAYVVDTGNNTRPATPSEIAEGLGFQACLDAHCTKERELMRRDVVGHRERQRHLKEHEQEIDSMIRAGVGINSMPHFSKANTAMVLTESSTATVPSSAMMDTSSVTMTRVTPSRPTSEMGQLMVTPSPPQPYGHAHPHWREDV